ncbi:MAG: hypothetical protein R3F34_10620 [Planctomycetota bacterium]
MHDPRRSRWPLGLAFAGAALVVVFAVFGDGDRDVGSGGPEVDVGERRADLATESSDGVDLAREAGAEVVERREVVAAPPAPSPAPSERRFVRVDLEPTPWFDEVPGGRLRVLHADARTTSLFPFEGSRCRMDRFAPELVTGADVGPFAAEIVAVEPLDPPQDGCTYRILVRLISGARLVWREDVDEADRVPVDVALGRDLGAESADPFQGGTNPEVARACSVELPVVLPECRAPVSLRVRAPFRREFAAKLSPRTSFVQVYAATASRLRVMHDRDPRANDRLVVESQGERTPLASFAIDARNEILIDHLVPRPCRVWIADGAGRVLSRLADVELVAGVESTVDLSSTGDRAAGSELVVTIPFDPRGLDPFGARVKFGVRFELREEGARNPWRLVRRLQRTDLVLDPSGTCATLTLHGAEPGTYRVSLDPFGATAEVVVHPGRDAAVEVPLVPFGRVRVELTEPAPPDALPLVLYASRSTARPAESVTFEVADVCFPPCEILLAAGTYEISASVNPDGLVRSEKFVVDGGDTTVRIENVALEHVDVVARDVATGDDVMLPPNFWNDIRVRGTATGHSPIRKRSTSTNEAGDSTARWSYEPTEEAVDLTFPVVEGFAFEPVEGVLLCEGGTIVIGVRTVP